MPIYPDKYRPRYPGGNASNKKKDRGVTIQPPPNHSVELKFHPVKPLMRKRPFDNKKDEKQENTIDLTADSENEDLIDLASSPGSLTKRRKVVDGGVKSQARGDHGAPLVPNKKEGISPEPQRKRGGRRSKAAIAVARVTRTLSMPLKASVTGANAANAIPIVPKKPLTTEEDITRQLLLVKTKMDDARKSMNTCQQTMKVLFDTHYQNFDNEEMMAALQKLSNHMNTVYDGGRDGVGEIDRAITLLRESKNLRDGIL